LPLADLPLDQLRGTILDGIAYDPPYTRLMGFIDMAARYDRVEWNIRYHMSKDGVYTLLPEVQRLRVIANVLKLRMRAEIKAGEFAKAIETSKTFFGLVRAFEQHPTLIGYLVGVAIASITVDALEEMVQQPGCPNIYWGLTELGSPVLDLHAAAQGERTFVSDQLRQLIDANGPVPDADLAKMLKMLDAVLETEEGKKKNDRTPATRQYRAMAADPKTVETARAFLIEFGTKPEAVKAYTPLQAVMTYDLRQHEVWRDEALKLIHLPMWQVQPLAKGVADDLEKIRGKLPLAPVVVPSVLNVRKAQARLDQRVAYLRVIEAIRLHAHETGGKLPASLDDLKLPIPMDPVTGKPFEYSVRNGEVAVLHGANPNPEHEPSNRYYEIRVRK
jgi:hypothetical protein